MTEKDKEELLFFSIDMDHRYSQIMELIDKLYSENKIDLELFEMSKRFYETIKRFIYTMRDKDERPIVRRRKPLT